MAKKPLYPKELALLLKRRKAGTKKKGNEAPEDKETGTDPHRGTEEIENDPRRDEETSETA